MERRGLSNSALCMPGKDVGVDAILAIEGSIYVNYFLIATRLSTSVIKVSGQMHSDEFKKG